MDSKSIDAYPLQETQLPVDFIMYLLKGQLDHDPPKPRITTQPWCKRQHSKNPISQNGGKEEKRRKHYQKRRSIGQGNYNRLLSNDVKIKTVVSIKTKSKFNLRVSLMTSYHPNEWIPCQRCNELH